ncbi:MAG: general stress protein CsbD [Flavobacteriales bacterium]|nr:general stress protein CsbD [Flavobacteriales bacterium]
MEHPFITPAPNNFKIASGTWGHKKFKLKNKFGHLNDDDLFFAEGHEAELIGRLCAKLNMSEADLHKLITSI